MNEPMIIKCNRMFSDKELEELRQKWNNQAAANEVVILPPGFELAKNEEMYELGKKHGAIVELEKIKDRLEVAMWYNRRDKEYCLEFIGKRISELKGE